jgi:DMSO/TMAO reductase YedYZ molybdopterin-dependent catalytic subunit
LDKSHGEKMKAVIMICIVFSFLLAGCISSGTKELTKVEIREYQGKHLDSITDVRDVSIQGPQEIRLADYKLEVTGLVSSPRNYTYEEVLSHQAYSKVVELDCTEGWNAVVLWQGVLLKDLFDDVKVDKKANTVIFYAFDGYTTSLPLDYIINKSILLAYKINNVTLDQARGFPFMLEAEDKFGYKWIKWVTKIELSDNSSFEGYWESRGYTNSGDLK